MRSPLAKTCGLFFALSTGLLISTTTIFGAGMLEGSQWRPIHLGTLELPQTTRLFVQFGGDNRLSGHGGCNRFFGSYQTSNGELGFGPLGCTRKMCPQPVMGHERSLLKSLAEAKTFDRQGVSLTLFDQEGQVLARFAQTDWD